MWVLKMTTIVTDRKTVVADCQISDGTLSYMGGKKIKAVGDWIIGAAGDLDSCKMFMDWFENCIKAGNSKVPTPKMNKNFIGIAVHKNGTIQEYTKALVAHEVREPYYAIGSGSHFALGALKAGASAKEALEIALYFDRNSGLGIDTLSHEKKKKEKTTNVSGS